MTQLRTRYIELRTPTVRDSESGAADMMRHLRTRQHLGTVLVICERPERMLATARKQWMKLSRTIQKQRAMTLNADKILKYTHTIIHMQSMRFTTLSPLDDPDGDVYFITASSLKLAPNQCYSVYVHTDLSQVKAALLIDQLPSEGLIIDYTGAPVWGTVGLPPKAELEHHITTEWRQVRHFLQSRSIDITELHSERQHRIEAMDDALDTLLEVPHRFLDIANSFQRALELARPVKVSKEMRLRYDALMLLAHRVQALTTPAFNQQFLESYNEDDTFYLYDRKRILREALRHEAAGRKNIANALRCSRRIVSGQADHRLGGTRPFILSSDISHARARSGISRRSVNTRQVVTNNRQ